MAVFCFLYFIVFYIVKASMLVTNTRNVNWYYDVKQSMMTGKMIMRKEMKKQMMKAAPNRWLVFCILTFSEGIAFGVMTILGEVTYWPVLLKAVRLLGDEKTQGRMFGFLEMSRGIIDVIVASSALAVFRAMDEGAAALRSGLLFLAIVTTLAGVLCLVFVPNDEKRLDENGKEVNKAQAAFGGMMQALKSVDIWAVALNGFTVYCIYCGLTYFIPFLNQIYMLPVAAVGMYGIVNQYRLKMVGGPLGEFLSDKVHKSAAKHIRMGFLVCIIAMAAFWIVSQV